MTEFQTRLLRLLTVGLILVGSLGMGMLNPAGKFYYILVVIGCMSYLFGTLVVEGLKSLSGMLHNAFDRHKDELAAPSRSTLDASQSW